jgi:hypothetical protein
MIKGLQFCAFNRPGNYFNLLPAVVVTPLRRVVKGWKLVRTGDFDNTTLPAIKERYPIRGVRVALKFWTFHVGVQFG